MPKPEEWVSTMDPSEGSEFGGVPGLVQPTPHDMLDEPSETANYARSVPADELIQVGQDDKGRPIMDWASTYVAPPTQLIRP